MTLVADLEVATGNTGLATLEEAVDDAVLRLPIVITADDSVLLYVLIDSADAGAFVTGVRRDGGDVDVERVDSIRGYDLLRVGFPRRSGTVIGDLAAARIEVLEAVGTAGSWMFRVRCPDADSLEAFTTHCDREGYAVYVDHVYEPSEAADNGPDGLTPEQERTLRLAYDEGYFEIPRKASLATLSDRLDVSDSAISGRLRRGIDSLLASRFDGADTDAPFDDTVSEVEDTTSVDGDTEPSTTDES